MTRVTRWILVALVGAAICTLGDHLHATHGVLTYAHVAFWNQAWWVFPLFFVASLAAVFGARVTRKMFRAAPLAPNDARRIAADGIAFATAYAMTSFTHEAANATLAVLVAFWIARMLAGAPRWLVVLSLANAALGPLVEAAISSTGAFTYDHPDFMLVARWLPGIYLHVAPISARLEALLPGAAETS
ncbi:MAG: hypothetical protein ACRELY_28750 [Polyangiaceae bacterium]